MNCKTTLHNTILIWYATTLTPCCTMLLHKANHASDLQLVTTELQDTINPWYIGMRILCLCYAARMCYYDLKFGKYTEKKFVCYMCVSCQVDSVNFRGLAVDLWVAEYRTLIASAQAGTLGVWIICSGWPVCMKSVLSGTADKSSLLKQCPPRPWKEKQEQREDGSIYCHNISVHVTWGRWPVVATFAV